MRSLLICAALLVLPAAARAQSVGGTIGVSAVVLAREEVQVAAGTGTGGVKMEREAGGALRMSVPLLLTHEVRPLVALQQRPGDPACELAAGGTRAAEGWNARLRCTSNTEGGWARLVISNN